MTLGQHIWRDLAFHLSCKLVEVGHLANCARYQQGIPVQMPTARPGRYNPMLTVVPGDGSGHQGGKGWLVVAAR